MSDKPSGGLRSGMPVPRSRRSELATPASNERVCEKAASSGADLLGFDGQWASHSNQIAIANEVFGPTADEIQEARAVIEAYQQAEAGGVGAIGRDGKLVDAAHLRLAANVLHKASRALGGNS